jgi:hypothetical protein
MSEKMFVTVWGLQKAEINAHCFGSCKKVIFGLLMDEQFGGLSHCFEVNCPFVEKEMSEPFGEVNGVNAYLRKLKAVEHSVEPTVESVGSEPVIVNQSESDLPA